MSTAFNRGITRNDLDYLNEAVKYEINSLAQLLADDIASLLKTLSAEQISYFENSVKKYNSDQAKKIPQHADKRKSSQMKKIVKMFTRIYGKFTVEQKAKIRAGYKRFPDNLHERIPYLESTQKQFVNHLRYSSKDELTGFLIKWITRDESLMTAAQRQKNLTLKKMSDELLLFTDKSIITKEQRAHAVNFWNDINSIIKDLQAGK